MGDIKLSTDPLHVFPVLLPFATSIRGSLVSSVPITHEDRFQIIVLELIGY